MIVDSKVKGLVQTVKITHGGLGPNSAKTLAQTAVDSLRLSLKVAQVKATVSIKYRKNSFDLVIKFKDADEQKKMEFPEDFEPSGE